MPCRAEASAAKTVVTTAIPPTSASRAVRLPSPPPVGSAFMALGYVRAARPDDAAEIARIQLTTWRYAYRRLLPARILEQLDQAWITERWLTAITEPPSGRHRVLVAVEQAEESYLVG